MIAFIFNSSQKPFRAKTNKIWQKNRSKKSTDVFAKLYMLKVQIPGKVTAHQIQSETTENIQTKIAQFAPNFDSMQRVLPDSTRIHATHETTQNHSFCSHPCYAIDATIFLEIARKFPITLMPASLFLQHSRIVLRLVQR
ncbi:hypothetical protein EBR21_11240, partial [bacterium]|nr:hypothetical protein [bacterium]